MNKAYSLLGLDIAALQNFSLQANMVCNAQNDRVIEKAVTQLERIENSALQSDKPINVSRQTVDQIIAKARRCAATKGGSGELTARELRILTYYLFEINDVNCVDYILSALRRQWRDIYFNGLIYCVMQFWTEMPSKMRNNLCQTIWHQLSCYKGKHPRYIELKNHSNIFDAAGPQRLARLVKSRQIPLNQAPVLIGFKEASFTQSYYDDVIISYYQQEDNVDLLQLEIVLKTHNSGKAKKMVLANLIITEEPKGDAIRQSAMCHTARSVLGDISLPEAWTPFPGATDEEKERLNKARMIVTTWYSRRVIETFFEVCVQDPNRRAFWLKYVSYIDGGFKIVGSVAVRTSLMADSRVSGLLGNNFILTNSKTHQTAALILYIRNKVFVEFSDLGSLYIYPPTHQAVRGLKICRRINSINDLKDSNMPKAIEQGYYEWEHTYNETGKLIHSGYWQNRLDRWMERMILPASAPIASKPTQTTSPTRTIVANKNTAPSPSRSFVQPTQQQHQQERIFFLKSKKIFDNCQIALASTGFYIIRLSDGHHRFLCNSQNTSTSGSNIWVRTANSEGFHPIVFHTLTNDIVIGFIKEDSGQITFKQLAGATVQFNINEI